MSVVSRNPFDLLGDDGGASSPAPSVKTPASKPAASPAPAASPREVPGSKAPRGRGGAEGGRGGRGGYYSRGGPRNVLKSEGQTSPATAGETTIVDPESGFDGERRAPSKSDRGRGGGAGRGEGRGRGGRGRGGGGRGGGEGGGYRGGYQGGGDRRQENRRSGHALPDSEKKIASGWGADEGEAELAAEVDGAKDASAEAAAPGTPAPGTPAPEGEQWAVDAPAAEAAPAAPEDPEAAAAAAAAKKAQEEEDNAKTYDEYLAERAKAVLAGGLNKLEGRKVEGTSDFVGEALKKQEEPEWYSGAGKDKSKTEKAKAPKKEKVFIDIEGRFAPPASADRGARGGRGGRGGSTRGPSDRPARGSSRGGRGGNRSSGPAPIQADDEKAFPALGA